MVFLRVQFFMILQYFVLCKVNFDKYVMFKKYLNDHRYLVFFFVVHFVRKLLFSSFTFQYLIVGNLSKLMGYEDYRRNCYTFILKRIYCFNYLEIKENPGLRLITRDTNLKYNKLSLTYLMLCTSLHHNKSIMFDNLTSSFLVCQLTVIALPE